MITPEMLFTGLFFQPNANVGGVVGAEPVVISGSLNLGQLADHLNRAQWREVSTDPPPMGETVLLTAVSAMGHNYVTAGMMYRHDSLGLAFAPDDGSERRYAIDEDALPLPTHWQPMPPPPGDV